MVLWRFSICQEPAAPLEITSITCFHVEAGLHAELDTLGKALNQAGDGNLVAHLGELAGAGRAQQFPHRA